MLDGRPAVMLHRPSCVPEGARGWNRLGWFSHPTGNYLGRKVMTNLDSILKSRDVTLPTKVHLVKAMVFPESCMDVRVGL